MEPHSKASLRKKNDRFFSHSITVTSESGVGSSSLLTALSVRLGLHWRYVSGGAIMRDMAKRHGMSIEAYSQYAKSHPNERIDIQVDTILKQIGWQNRLVSESRLAHINVPNAFHVLLTCPYEIRAKRRSADWRKKEEYEHMKQGDLEELVLKQLQERDEADKARYSKFYPGWQWNEQEFDLVLSSGDANHPPAVLAGEILEAHEKWLKSLPEDQVTHDLYSM